MNATSQSLAGLLSSPPANLALGGLGLLSAPAAPQWIGVRQRFEQFHRNLQLTELQYQDGATKCAGVVACLNRNYYGTSSSTDNTFLIGSWGKSTATRPPRDVDVYFVLPPEVYQRFEGNIWNRQSTLLQEVKGVLSGTYPATDMSGDGQVVVVRFESYAVEVVPAFLLQSGQYWICDTHNGGSYKKTDPWAEIQYIETVDQANNHNLRPLIRMLKAWQANCSVPIKSFQIELLAAEFIAQSPWRFRDAFWFDWLIRDLFAYMYYRANTNIMVPGTYELIPLGNAWQSRAESAYGRAAKACDYERDNLVLTAGEEWQKIFGQQIPRAV